EGLLAEYLVDQFGAPGEEAALAAAREEVAFGRELAEGAALDTLLALKREIGDDGLINERFHIVTPPGEKPHALVWDVVEEP
ncbi:DUF6505 family protein, partial [Roseibium sp.]|uniref:DUF6505 family protein n=1 Tax=Roseibium sp. TaxID=1936156 RepID=UPI0032969079